MPNPIGQAQPSLQPTINITGHSLEDWIQKIQQTIQDCYQSFCRILVSILSPLAYLLFPATHGLSPPTQDNPAGVLTRDINLERIQKIDDLIKEKNSLIEQLKVHEITTKMNPLLFPLSVVDWSALIFKDRRLKAIDEELQKLLNQDSEGPISAKL